VTISLSLLELGQIRPKPREGERYHISWSKDGIPTRYNGVSITLPIEEARGAWDVQVQFVTLEVRKDLRGVMRDFVSFEIDEAEEPYLNF
jgi:hypothetical protein